MYKREKVTREEFDEKITVLGGRVYRLMRDVEDVIEDAYDVFSDYAAGEAAMREQNSDVAFYDAAFKDVYAVKAYFNGVAELLEEAEGRLNAFIENGGV